MVSNDITNTISLFQYVQFRKLGLHANGFIPPPAMFPSITYHIMCATQITTWPVPVDVAMAYNLVESASPSMLGQANWLREVQPIIHFTYSTSHTSILFSWTQYHQLLNAMSEQVMLLFIAQLADVHFLVWHTIYYYMYYVHALHMDLGPICKLTCFLKAIHNI